MAEFNGYDCLSDPNNTGAGLCNAEFGKMIGEIAVPRGTTFTRAQIDTLPALLAALMIEDSPVDRGYMLPYWILITENTADPVMEDFDFGVQYVIGNSAESLIRRFKAGGLCAQLNMLSFNGQESRYEWLRVYMAPSGGYYIAGRRYYNTTTEVYDMRGYTYTQMYTFPLKHATGTTSQMFQTMSNVADVAQFNQNLFFIKTDWNPFDLPQVSNVDITWVKQSTGVFDALAIQKCGGANLTVLYPALADSDAFIVLNQLGNVVATTGVTIVAGKFRIALDTADANYTAGTTFTVQLAPISITAAAPFNVEWIESGVSNAVAK